MDERAPAIDERWYYYCYYSEVLRLRWPVAAAESSSRVVWWLIAREITSSSVVSDGRYVYLPAPCEFDYRPVIIIVEKDAGTNQTDAACHYNNIITLNYRYYCYYYCYWVDVIRYCGGQVSYSAVGQPRFSHTPVIRFPASLVSTYYIL